jgi:heme a synthase
MATPSQPAPSTARGFPWGLVLTYGFGTALAIWIAWFFTHLPWLGIPEPVSIPVLLLVWLAGMVSAGRKCLPSKGLGTTAATGLVTALVGLLIIGTKLVEAPDAANTAGSVVPNAPLRIAGFLALGAVVGAIGGFIGGRAPRPETGPDWLARFSIVAALTVAPLLFIGGLVTSTGSGMAVPDWPGTYGSNMFLYPLGPRARPDVYLEHSHRLFGTLLGLTTLVLMFWILAKDQRRWLKILAVIAFALVAIQGYAGGIRVTENSRILAMLHGILGQLVFALWVAIAVFLSPTWKRITHIDQVLEVEAPLIRRAKFFCTGVLHATLLQLLLGAVVRHITKNGVPSPHALWTHAAFAFIVLVFAIAAGFVASAIRGRYDGLGPIVRALGLSLLVVVALQFALGWAAFGVLSARNSEAILPALVRTAHQANGALLLAVATMAFFWSKRLARLSAATLAEDPRKTH